MKRRDYIILPLIVIATLLVVIIPVEAGLRYFFPYNEADQCVVYGDPRPSAFHAKPNCRSDIKVPEGPWVEMKYNECGFRSADHCTPKKPGSLRVAIIGSSLSAGYLVPYDEALAGRASTMLKSMCRSRVDFQNLGAEGNMGARLIASAQAAADLKPDTMVFVVSPTDLALDNGLEAAKPKAGAVAKPETNMMREIKATISSSRLFYMESYLLLRNDDNYVPIYVRSGNNADFMRTPLSQAWESRLAHLERDIRQIKAVADAASVPLLVVFVPQRVQAAMMAVPRLAKGFDPRLIQRRIKTIAEGSGAIFTDMSGMIKPAMSSHQIYYAMNGHLNSAGHGLLAHTVVDALLQEKQAGFQTMCTATPALKR